MSKVDDAKGYAVEVMIRGKWVAWREYAASSRGHANRAARFLKSIGHEVRIQALLVNPKERAK